MRQAIPYQRREYGSVQKVLSGSGFAFDLMRIYIPPSMSIQYLQHVMGGCLLAPVPYNTGRALDNLNKPINQD